jgi:hypothetical protein
MLVVTGLVSAPAAMDLKQAAPATAEAPGFKLPAFLDMARLPDLQEAWRDQASFLGASPVAEPAVAPANAAPSVRSRAEELSSRFGAGSAQSVDPRSVDPQAAASVQAVSSTETASITSVEAPVAPSAELGPAASDYSTPDRIAEVPVRKPSFAKDAAPVIEDMATKPIKRYKRAADAQRVQTAERAPVSTGLLRIDPAAPKPQTNSLMPTEIRAFGWNAQ